MLKDFTDSELASVIQLAGFDVKVYTGITVSMFYLSCQDYPMCMVTRQDGWFSFKFSKETKVTNSRERAAAFRWSLRAVNKEFRKNKLLYTHKSYAMSEVSTLFFKISVLDDLEVLIETLNATLKLLTPVLGIPEPEILV